MYDRNAWGQDTIKATNGSITLLFRDLTAKDLKFNLDHGKMLITRQAHISQTITVEGWQNSTHNIVYGKNLNNFDSYIKVTHPSQAITTSARNEIWGKAKLA